MSICESDIPSLEQESEFFHQIPPPSSHSSHNAVDDIEKWWFDKTWVTLEVYVMEWVNGNGNLQGVANI